MYSNVTRISGLSSGLDTASMVTQLMRAESLKMDKLKQKHQLLEWKQQSYRDVASVLRSFQSSMLSLTSSTSIRLSTAFTSLSTSVTGADGKESTAIKASVKDATATGSFTLDVEKLATKDIYLGKSVKMDYSSTEGMSKETIETLKAGDSFTISLDGAKAVTFTLEREDLQGADGNALSADQIVANINNKLKNHFKSDATATGTSQKVAFEFDDTKGTFSFIAGSGHTVTVGKGGTDNDALATLGFVGGGTTAFNGSTKLGDMGLFEDVASTGSLTWVINGKEISFTSDNTIDELMEKVNESGANVTLSYDKLRSSFKLESNDTGASAEIEMSMKLGTDSDAINDYHFLENMGFVSYERDAANNINKGADGSPIVKERHHTAAGDAKFLYNGVEVYRESNTFELEGISVTLTEAAKGAGKITVGLARDVSGAVDNIKKFIEEYNKVIDAITGLTNTSRPKSGQYTYYEPLTDAQKKEMSEKEIEQWETKAKTGVLYRDDILTSLNSKLRSMMYAPVALEGEGRGSNETIALYQIGITTSTEGGYVGKLQIDEAKLKEALERDPEAVQQLFTKSSSMPGTSVSARNARLTDEGLGDRLNDIIVNTIESGGSIYKRAGFENTSSAKNNEMYYQLTAQEDKISSMLKYLTDKENYYYQMFSRMETAMSKADSQYSAISALLA